MPEVVCGWPEVVRGWRLAVPDGQRRKVGEIGVSSGLGAGPLVGCSTRSGSSPVFLRTTHDFGHHAHFQKKKRCAQAGDGGRERARARTHCWQRTKLVCIALQCTCTRAHGVTHITQCMWRLHTHARCVAIFGQGGFCFFSHPTLGFPAEVAAPRSGCEIGVSAGQGQTPWSAARPRSGGSSVFRRTTHDVGHRAHFSPKNKDVRRRGRWAGARACTNALLPYNIYIYIYIFCLSSGERATAPQPAVFHLPRLEFLHQCTLPIL